MGNKKIKLTPKELLFCQYYTDFGCTGVDALYKAGYKPKSRRTAISMASEYLTKPDILSYIKDYFDNIKLTLEEVSHEHWHLIKQNGDLHVKLKAIDMFYRKNNMYNEKTPEKKPSTVIVMDYASASKQKD